MSNFEFLSVLFAIVIGIGFAHLLLSIGRILGEVKSLNVGAVQLIWTGNILLVLVTYWWWLLNLRGAEQWVFHELLILLFQASLWVLLAATLYPIAIPQGYDLKAHFEKKRKSFFTILALAGFVDPLSAMIVGSEHLTDLGWPYLNFTVACFAGGIAGIRFKNERFQQVLASYWGFSLIILSLSPGLVLDLYQAKGPILLARKPAQDTRRARTTPGSHQSILQTVTIQIR